MNKFAFYKETWKQQPGFSVFIAVIFFTSCVLIISASWKVFIGIILLLWSQNLEKYINGLIKLPEDEDVHTQK